MEHTLDYETVVLPNGLTLSYREVDSPDVALAISIRNGRLYEPKDKAGISHFVEHLFLTDREFTERLELITGRNVNATTSHEEISFGKTLSTM